MAPVAGAPMSQGNRRLVGVPRERDAEVVARYRKAGLVFVGKTNVPEFGLAPVTESEALGPCRNPWNPDYTPGGSSGGAAAAVAARICADGACDRWRRLDPRSRFLLRAVRAQADARPHAERPRSGRDLARLLGLPRDDPFGAR